LPRWNTIITANEIFGNTAGGAMPSTIERVSNYTPLNTSNFAHVLSSNDNNLQAAMDKIDDHEHTYSDILGMNGDLLTVPAGATYYLAPYGGLTAVGGGTAYPKSGTLKNLYVLTGNAQPATGSLVFTVQLAGSSKSIVVTVPAGGGSAIYSDTTHSEAVTPASGIRIMVKNNAPAAASAQIAGVTLEISGLSTV
jgi:hypothetical protein